MVRNGSLPRSTAKSCSPGTNSKPYAENPKRLATVITLADAPAENPARATIGINRSLRSTEDYVLRNSCYVLNVINPKRDSRISLIRNLIHVYRQSSPRHLALPSKHPCHPCSSR